MSAVSVPRMRSYGSGTYAPRVDAPASEPVGRRERRRRETRDRLVKAACTLIAEKGVERLTLAELAEEADLGLGTFYTYFDTKEEIIEAAAASLMHSLAEHADALLVDLNDPAERVSVGIRDTINIATRSPALASLLVQLLASERRDLWAPLVRRHMHEYGAGVKAGRWPANVVVAAALTGAIREVIAAELRGRLEGNAASEMAEMALVSLGLPREEAHTIANRPVPTTSAAIDF